MISPPSFSAEGAEFHSKASVKIPIILSTEASFIISERTFLTRFKTSGRSLSSHFMKNLAMFSLRAYVSSFFSCTSFGAKSLKSPKNRSFCRIMSLPYPRNISFTACSAVSSVSGEAAARDIPQNGQTVCSENRGLAFHSEPHEKHRIFYLLWKRANRSPPRKIIQISL